MTSGLVAVCTGASGSIGAAICAALLEAGFCREVHGVYRTNNDLVEQLRKKRGFVPICTDLTESKYDAFPKRSDILVHSAGLAAGKSLFLDVEAEEIDEVFDLNTRSAMKLARLYLPGMVRNKFGRLIFVNSIWGLRGSKNNTSYTVSKHALSGLTKTLAKEYGSFGVTSNEICPGAVRSRMIDRIAKEWAEKEGKNPAEIIREFDSAQPRGSMVTPDEVASAVVFLASPSASGVNGTSLPVDGGYIA